MNIQVPGQARRESNAAIRAGGSSFYLAMRILHRHQREAMFEIYSFCRTVDDIADCDAPRHWRLARLADWRDNVEAIYAGRAPADLAGLAASVQRFSLGQNDFNDLIAGMEMDAAADIRAPHLAELDSYCDRVACAVGRLSVRVFGMNEDDGRRLAHYLGQALQLTNILRDLDEDAALGRLYLPREALAMAGIDTTEPASVMLHPRLGGACRLMADRARDHFAMADQIMRGCSRHLVRAPRIMAEVYREMLEEMIARGWALPRSRIHVPKSHLLWIALRHAIV